MIRCEKTYDVLEYQENFFDAIQRVNEQRSPEMITVDGKPKAVVLDIKMYEELLQQIELAETVAAIQEGLEDARQGNIVSLEEFLGEMKAVYGAKYHP